jgi:deoxyxylulose-5-phosphate synthase
MFWKVWRMSDLEKMDKETNRILDILAENELSTAENIAVVTKVLIILLKIEELNSMTEEEKQIVQKAREKIAFYITRGGVE